MKFLVKTLKIKLKKFGLDDIDEKEYKLSAEQYEELLMLLHSFWYKNTFLKKKNE